MTIQFEVDSKLTEQLVEVTTRDLMRIVANRAERCMMIFIQGPEGHICFAKGSDNRGPTIMATGINSALLKMDLPFHGVFACGLLRGLVERIYKAGVAPEVDHQQVDALIQVLEAIKGDTNEN